MDATGSLFAALAPAEAAVATTGLPTPVAARAVFEMTVFEATTVLETMSLETIGLAATATAVAGTVAAEPERTGSAGVVAA
ncbi:MAG TPA: hypothetical protein VLZ78_02355 [Terrimesophilobacter sp.]|nr:hypothetical protein [Terrimesophilobacter sp.]